MDTFNFVFLSIKKAIIHRIKILNEASHHATVDYSDELLTLSDSVKSTIKERLLDAFNKQSKSFVMTIKDFNNDTFPFICSELLSSTQETQDSLFISKSKQIVDKLAEQHDTKSIPPGYVLILEAIDESTTFPCLIVIKAEPHNALSITGSNAEALEVILSPSQKLFKVGVIFKKRLEQELNNSNYGAQIFDDQFTSAKPAMYFFEDFLNFSINQNAKYNTSKFYESVLSFISSNYSNPQEREEMYMALRVYLFLNTETHVNLNNFAELYISDIDLKLAFEEQIINQMQPVFVKDFSLLKSKIKNQSILFESGVKMNIPAVAQTSENKLYEILQEQPDPLYTFIKIQGKPFCSKKS